jgi:hypothetical protein
VADRAQSFVKTVAIVAAGAAVAAVPLAGKGKPPAPTALSIVVVDGNGATVPDVHVGISDGETQSTATDLFMLRDDAIWKVDWAGKVSPILTVGGREFIDPDCSVPFFPKVVTTTSQPLHGIQSTIDVRSPDWTSAGFVSADSAETGTVNLYYASSDGDNMLCLPGQPAYKYTYVDTSSVQFLTKPADLVGPLRLKAS